MFGFSRRGVDPFGLPPQWWVPDRFVPVAPVGLGVATPVTAIRLASGLTAAAVVVAAPVPFLWAPFVDVVARRDVQIGGLAPTPTTRVKSPRFAATVMGAAAVLRVRHLPDGAAVALRGAVPAAAVAMPVSSASVVVGGKEPSAKAIHVPLPGAVWVAVTLPDLAVVVTTGAVRPRVEARAAYAGPWHQPPAANISAAGGVGQVQVMQRAHPALVWIDVRAPLGAGRAGQPRVIVLNAQTLGISEYALAWSDVAVLDGVVYGLSAAGIEQLAGPLEATATPLIETGALVLAPVGSVANLSHAYAEVAADAPLRVSTMINEAGVSRTIAYALPVVPGAPPLTRARTVPLGRGVQADAWTLQVAGQAPGAAWELRQLAVQIDRVKQRR